MMQLPVLIKVFGERNCGTNFLTALLARNLRGDAIVLGAPGDRDYRSPGMAELVTGVPGKPAQDQVAARGLKPVAFEAFKDEASRQGFDRNFGWKHAAVSVACLQRSAVFARGRFVFLVRNPYYFCAALHRRPYNLLPRPRGNLARSDFVRARFRPNARDKLTVADFNAPELWNLKVRSYVAAADALGDDALLLRYEDLVPDPEHVVATIADRFGLGRAEAFALVEKSTKGDGRSFADFQRIVADYTPAVDHAAEDIAWLRGQFDAALLARLGY